MELLLKELDLPLSVRSSRRDWLLAQGLCTLLGGQGASSQPQVFAPAAWKGKNENTEQQTGRDTERKVSARITLSKTRLSSGRTCVLKPDGRPLRFFLCFLRLYIITHVRSLDPYPPVYPHLASSSIGNDGEFERRMQATRLSRCC